MIHDAGWIFLLLQIFFVDLLLGADNAVAIAVACSKLPPEDTRRAVFVGALGAIVLRLGMLAFANALLDFPFVKLIAAWTLVVIALNVSVRKANDGEPTAPSRKVAGDLLAVAAIITLVDAAMSLDNVVALAAIAGGDFWLLALGVLLSVPILAYGSIILNEILRRAPEVLTLGAIVLGWIAGEMAVSDPLVAAWIKTHAPVLPALVPAFAAVFVWIAGRGAQKPLWAPTSAIRGEPLASAPTSMPPLDPVRAQYVAGERPLSEASVPAHPAGPLQFHAPSGWSEESVVVFGFVALAALAGLIIFIASILDSFT